MEEKEILAKNLISYRKKAGLSQLELAKKLNYSNKNISKWENGETMPSAFVLKKIANIYGVSVEDLLSDKPIMQDVQHEPKKNIRKTVFRLTMLLLANAIMFALGTALVYILKMVGVTNFNLNLIYLYLSPLAFLSILIYIRVIYKFVDMITLSAINWLFWLMFYLTFMDAANMSFIFVLAGVFQVIDICIALLINLKILKVRPFKKK